jgi:hypothetical protein
MIRRIFPLLALVVPLAFAAAARAVIIDDPDGTGNTSAPTSNPPDPGWDHVGVCNYLSCVYIGGGWVLTANHVGAGDATFGGVVYPWWPGSNLRLHNPAPDGSYADLLMFRLYPPYPPLGDLTISATSPLPGTDLVLIGKGRDRGAPTTWHAGPGQNYDGYLWGPGATMRWGTNTIQTVPELPLFESGLGTQLFASVFDQSGLGHTNHEAQAAVGDSGGAAFAEAGSGYELAGILEAIATYDGQPSETALYGNYTLSTDLAVYRDEIVTNMPEPRGGLAAGVVLVSLLASAETRRACRGTACATSSPPRA